MSKPVHTQGREYTVSMLQEQGAGGCLTNLTTGDNVNLRVNSHLEHTKEYQKMSAQNRKYLASIGHCFRENDGAEKKEKLSSNGELWSVF